VANIFAYGQRPPTPYYNTEVQICLYDTWANWSDRPNTRISSCLHEQFGLPWLAQYGRYAVRVRPESVMAAQTLLYGWEGGGLSLKAEGRRTRNMRIVALHYEGDSSQERKNLTHSQADEICQAIKRLGCMPLILDWRQRCPLPYWRLRIPADWGKDAEMVCATIAQCAAFVGIDSGPSKCASATDTPALVVWVGHHPAPFHDPAPNTTHAVPEGYHGLEPVCNDAEVIQWFEAHHRTRQYVPERGPVEVVKEWLAEMLK
jgi:hypothetical protein